MSTKRADPNAKVKAAIYCRISKDRAGAGLGVDRQEKDCRELAERLGWEVVAVYVDNDLSAYSGKRRPDYEAMLKAVRDREVEGILTWHTDRLTRRVADLDGFVRLADERGLQIQTVKAGEVDLTTPSGRMVARTLGNIAQYEVEHAKDRMKAAKRQAAQAGRYRGGPRPFGFESDGVAIREEEAEEIRAATRGILSGRSLAALARELNDRGVKTTTGKEWTYMRLRDVLVRPRNAGLIHRGRADRRTETNEEVPAFEVIGKAEWDAIVDEDTWRACTATLLDPSRRIPNPTHTRWIGTRTYFCGIEGCGALMRPTSKVDHIRSCEVRSKARGCACPRRYYYRCSERNHLAIAAAKTDKFVREVVVDLVRDPRLAQALDPGDEGLAADKARRQVLVTSLEQTERDYDEDLIDARRYKAKSDRIAAEIAEIDERLTSGIQRSLSSKVLRAPDPGVAFKEAPIDVQRAVVRALLRVTVQPTQARGVKWSSQRLVIDPVHEVSGL